MICFCWGLVAFLGASYLNSAIALGFHLSNHDMTVSIAPIVEEFLKFIPLLVFLFRRMPVRKFAILYCGMAVGIGFSIQENYLYLQQYRMFQQESVLTLVVLRGVSTSLMHGLTTAIAGFGICLMKDFKFFTFHLTFGLLAFAISSHSLFNLYINSPLKILGLFMPLLIYIFGVVALNSIEES